MLDTHLGTFHKISLTTQHLTLKVSLFEATTRRGTATGKEQACHSQELVQDLGHPAQPRKRIEQNMSSFSSQDSQVLSICAWPKSTMKQTMDFSLT